MLFTKRGVKTVALVIIGMIGVGLGFSARRLLDQLMASYPDWAVVIDHFGQLLYALLLVWLCIIPLFRMYGVISNRKGSEV